MTTEELVALYLERREREPLTPEAYCAEQAPDSPERQVELARAIQRTLDAVALFQPLPREFVPSAHSGEAPRRLGEWELLRELGRGGMGVVFEARRTGHADEAPVALKTMPLAGLLGPRSLERFEREARVLSRLDDERIVSARDFGTDGDVPYLVMDLVPGASLHELAGTLTVAQAAALVGTLARAVHGAHALGVLHRDIKPSNVIVRPDGTPVLLDFGLTASEIDESLTSTGDMLGTPRYMAPEQARGEPATVASDVWALGAVLFELVSGQPAFPQDSRAAVLTAVADGRWSRSAVRASNEGNVTPDLDRVLRVAMAWRPSRRHASAADLADDLERLARGDPVHARPPGPTARLIDGVARRPLRAAMLASTAALVLTLALFVLRPWWNERQATRQAEHARLLDHAVAHWVRGREQDASRLVERLLQEAPQHAAAGRLRLELGLASPPAPAAEAADESSNEADARGPPTSFSPADGEPTRKPGLDQLTLGLAARRAGDLDQAGLHFAAAVAAVPDATWCRVALADNAAARDQWHEAEALLVEASQRMPDSKAVAQELARVYAARRKLADAERECRRALALDPDDPHLWHALARSVFLAKHDDEGALAAARRATELFGDVEPANANLEAALLDRLGRHAESQAVFRQLIEAYPEHVGYVFNLAFSLAAEGREAEALPLYRQVLAREPGQLEATLALAWLLGTSTDDELRDPETGEALLLEALRHDTGRSPQLIGTIEQFAQRTGRSPRLVQLLDELARQGETDGRTLRLARARDAVAASLEESP